ncbi:glycosyltransferase [Ideonella sp.]|uniref:glycosyltransferase n=1 Tax=Ideonella sp. TaxID=1929293 RepID=UPI0035B30456
MRFAVVTLGSAGDLHPFLAIARELVRRGHQVTLLSQAPYEGQSLAEGVPFQSVADTAAHERTLKHPLLWHPLHGFGVLWRHLAVPAIGPTCEILGELAHGSAQEGLTVLASPLAAGARFARERWPGRVRLLSGYTAPMGLRSIEDPMFLGAWQIPNWAPPPLRRALWHLLDRWKLEPMSQPALRRWQREWQTPSIQTSAFGDWLHSPDGGVALYPEEFASVPMNWRQRGVVQTGFPLFEPSQVPSQPAALAEFTSRHPRYVLVYPGSAAAAAARFTDLVLPACRQLGLAAIVLSPHLHRDSHQGIQEASDVLAIEQAPLGQLLSGAAAFVHHGGIGSVAQALRHRVPQLVLASAYDQFENGSRVARLRAGDWMPLRHASTTKVAGRLGNQLSPPTLTALDSRPPQWPLITPSATRTCAYLERA